jgi:hypothetical protein
MSHSRRYPRAFLALLLALALLAPTLALTPAARAAACVVTVATDDILHPPGGSLRQKLADNACTTITFQPGLGTITLAGTLPIYRAVTVTGPGKDALTIQGNITFPLLTIAPSLHTAVTISGLTLTKGHAANGYGGNLASRGADLTLTDVALTTAPPPPASAGRGPPSAAAPSP